MSELREWILDRYHNGMRMAEGARVTASSLEEAISKAKSLPGVPSFWEDDFLERPGSRKEVKNEPI